MLVFFEGHDKSGKTTIAKALVKTLKVLGKNVAYLKDLDSYEAIKHNNDIALCSHIGLYGSLYFKYLDPSLILIVDRYVLSDIVYSKVFNRKTDSKINNRILTEVKSLGGIHIICYKTGDLQKDELFSNQDKIRDEYLKFNDTNIFKLDTTDENLIKQVKTCIEIISNYRK